MFESVKDLYSQTHIRRGVLIAGCASLLVLGGCGVVDSLHNPNHPITAAGNYNTHSWPAQIMEDSGDAGLRQLARMNMIFNSQLPDSLMLFTGMPSSVEAAPHDAAAMAATLKAYQSAGIKPLVIMEPTSSGKTLALSEIAAGQFDDALTAFYTELKAQGVTDQMMGQWTVLPEANTPAWDTTDPTIVRDGIIHIAQTQKAVFPASKVSIMLDSQSYQGMDWAEGSYTSLVPYVQGIPSGLIDSFGLQGFPWVDQGASADSMDIQSPKTYLSARMAMEAAAALGTHNIWFNTGSFARMHTNIPGQVQISPTQRRQLLQTAGQEIIYAKTLGYNVTVNIFAEDKSQANEATDWSYHRSADDTKVLTDFVATMRKAGVRISYFDDGSSD